MRRSSQLINGTMRRRGLHASRAGEASNPGPKAQAQARSKAGAPSSSSASGSRHPDASRA
eukprot:12913097-Prorocentrum_lima.AAC.1